MRLLRGVLCIFQRQVFSRVFGLLKYRLAIHDPHNKNYWRWRFIQKPHFAFLAVNMLK